MKTARQPAPSALDVIEEAVHLLRTTPAADYLVWAAGAGPFALAVLYFWADMSRAADAENRLMPAALGLALLFLWLKTCQSVFATRLLARLSGVDASRGHVRRWFRCFSVQAAWQPLGLFLLPIGLILTVPFGWLVALFQNLTVLGADSPMAAFRRAGRQCLLHPVQNHALISLLSVAALAVWLNVAIALYALPHLLKLLLGVESAFTLNPTSLLNTTFLASTFALSAVIMDPLLKAAYVVRCFHGEARTTGEDLRARLRRWQPAMAAALLLFAFLGGQPATTSVARAATPTPQQVSELDRAIEDVLERPECTWRAPRESDAESEIAEPKGWLARLRHWIGDRVERGFRQLGRLLKRFADWLDQTWGRRSGPSLGWNWNLNPAGFVSFLMWLLLITAAGLLLWFAFVVWRRRQPAPMLTATAISAVPDLRTENVAVEQLPEEGWLALAHELAGSGELRLALRALYLASLAHLARREFIRPALHKSNRDYELEVRRRARSIPTLSETFADTVRTFERSWYGGRGISAEHFAQFEAKVQEVRAR